MRGFLRAQLAAFALAMGAGTALANPLVIKPGPIAAAPVPRGARAPRSVGNVSRRGLIGRKGAGITMAQQQRTAAKKRNRARHRRACR